MEEKLSDSFISMDSSKKTEPVKKKVRFLKLSQISELVMDSDSDESDSGYNEAVGEDEDYEELVAITPSFQEDQALSLSDYTRYLSADANAEIPHSPM
jgi:hypothetical protein